MNVLLLASHAVAEYDDTRMFHDLGYEVFTPGGYEDPRTGTEGIRPPLPQVPFHADLAQRCREQREAFGEPGEAIDWAKARLHDDVIDWADVIIVHHFPRVWIGGQWDRIRHKRVVWRTCGQSDPSLEDFMSRFEGLEIVRYSPAERRYFEPRGAWAGETTLIRFGKYPNDYGPWAGDDLVIGNVTQDMVARGDATGLTSWRDITIGLPTKPAGKGSEALPGGIGMLSYPDMLDYLRHIRTYLYTGTRPASYTLGLIEAMLSGVPVVTVAPETFGHGWDGADLFEADQIANVGVTYFGGDYRPEDPAWIAALLQGLLSPYEHDAGRLGSEQRAKAIALFGIGTIGRQWREFLS